MQMRSREIQGKPAEESWLIAREEEKTGSEMTVNRCELVHRYESRNQILKNVSIIIALSYLYKTHLYNANLVKQISTMQVCFVGNRVEK